MGSGRPHCSLSRAAVVLQLSDMQPGVMRVLGVQALHDPMAEMEELARASGQKGCAFCGGLGHRVADCPKLASQVRPTDPHAA